MQGFFSKGEYSGTKPKTFLQVRGKPNTLPLKTVFLLLAIATAVVFCLPYRHLFFCETVQFGQFSEPAENIFISPGIARKEHAKILRMLETAENRVNAFWGEKKGRATVIVCATPAEYGRYCPNKEGAGCSLGTFYGNSFIVLNLYGINPDVISHEMCHNEVFSRLGWRKTTFAIPQWFNEGLAMMLDYRFVNTPNSAARYERYLKEWRLRTVPPAKKLRLAEISTLNGFFGGDARHVTLAYLTAATEVSHWLLLVGQKGLIQWTEAIQRGDRFEVYYEIENLHRKITPHPGNPVRRLDQAQPSE
ncbi:hypothetical protein GCM10023091_40560 [Ravibacter arvi]|uniref:DUF1570 domain-containing protein n=1 Tax=Ravibacter arvi TaxID=2051041 RepID=A0ABP8MCI7_9BACT